ncbi:unnamed protein product [Peronospora belbahrii]|uniref:Uncharacterized protein n=1 Tax=Peronospora belbahrii TaxID=622444 RepID=A0ABN8CWP6_9STRA|nr:unnamed protein product [Peronospora belbahrii]
MNNDDIRAAEEIVRQITALKPRVDGSRGIMAYVEKPQVEKRTDVNKTFLASTIRSVKLHNQRQEEDKCWTLHHLEEKMDVSRHWHGSRRKSYSRNCSIESSRICGRKRRSVSSRSRSRSRSSRRWEEREVSRRSNQGCDCSNVHEFDDKKREMQDERNYWAQKKAGKVRKLWENLHAEGTVSVENAPDFSEEESDDDDVKPIEAKVLPSPEDKKKKHKKHKKHKKDKKHKK